MLARNQDAELRRHNPAFGIMKMFAADAGRTDAKAASASAKITSRVRIGLHPEMLIPRLWCDGAVGLLGTAIG